MDTPLPAAGADLAPDYYLSNFNLLVRHVVDRCRHLLSADELAWLIRFNALGPAPQRLLVRLLSRKGPLFRLDKLRYDEIPDLHHCAKALVDARLARWHPAPGWQELASLCTKRELLALVPEADARLSKTELLASLAPLPLPEHRLSVLALEQRAILDTLRLLYFGNLHQDLAQFVVSDLGIQRFESYPLTADGLEIDSRETLEAWLSQEVLSRECQRCLEQRDGDALLQLAPGLPGPLPWPELERKRQKTALLVAREWERREAFDQALVLYRQSTLPPSRERQARIALKRQRSLRAVTLVTRMLVSPLDEQEATVAARLGKQLARQGHWHWSPLTTHAPKQERLVLANSGERVELQVAAHYAAAGWRVFYCENALLNGLLGLVIWPSMFAPVAGAFVNPYQQGPRDLYRPEFVPRRQASLRAELANWTPERLLERYRLKQGIANPLVQWDRFPADLAEQALHSLPRALLSACFERLLFDLRGNRSGHPDLFLVQGRQARWLEVKGPGDRLQDNQSRWLNFLEGQGARVSVCQVSFE
ncbi:VRR-NUC domain-containing protein [Ferrimonas sediminicola]|uniref:phosphodiesterase I n=1 Tax=Ferrimonas sediminicola TaxID=2569538 RepID=A0A4U1BJG5_9GAMM|nr:VRR-NUC domain-containing protein [Ferrimonas sediminicola]TKB50250.1 VRR-NUC domain-containing protein [Ferrimonas sediminicola]